MDEILRDIRSRKNPKVRIKVAEGHFATTHSHVNVYIDMTTIKYRHNNAKETAKELVSEYVNTKSVDTIVCLEGTEVIGGFMAEILADYSVMSFNSGKNISIITPEINNIGQMIFRDNIQRMIRNMQVLLLVASATTGQTVGQALECVDYYGGEVCGVAALFSATKSFHGYDINALFTDKDLPHYETYSYHDCPYCKNKIKLDAIINGYGYSKL